MMLNVVGSLAICWTMLASLVLHVPILGPQVPHQDAAAKAPNKTVNKARRVDYGQNQKNKHLIKTPNSLRKRKALPRVKACFVSKLPPPGLASWPLGPPAPIAGHPAISKAFAQVQDSGHFEPQCSNRGPQVLLKLPTETLALA